MYLAPGDTELYPKERGMDRPARAAKLADIWKHPVAFEETMLGLFLAGDHVMRADFTWFLTCVLME